MASLSIRLRSAHYGVQKASTVQDETDISPIAVEKDSMSSSFESPSFADSNVEEDDLSAIHNIDEEDAAFFQEVVLENTERIQIGGDRFIVPGDYIMHEDYGIGQYKGIRSVDLTPAKSTQTMQKVVMIQYDDSILEIYNRLAKKELWLFRTAESGKQELSTILDTRKWRRRMNAQIGNSKNTAINLVKMAAIRSGYHRTPCVSRDERYTRFENGFKYPPTTDQKQAFDAIENDMVNKTRPMDRLVCGDVGFGKTEVAMRAIYRTVLTKRQVAVLAPTRVLSLQHLRVFRSRMPDVNIQLLRGGKSKVGEATKVDVASGVCQVLIGTHAILQDKLKFANLGLVVIDEEQRFGVQQKEKLKSVASGVDLLTLSATPIPRTLQMSLSGLRDFSLINTPPAGRKEVNVTTGRFNEEEMSFALQRELNRDGQAFIVVPFVKNITHAEALISRCMPGVSYISACGQHTDLEERIDYFSAGKAKILIATTVVENGIDMPNVNTIIVLDSHYFGMSTLYQLRGRVGRSDKQAFAYFYTRQDRRLTDRAEARLMYLSTFTALGSGYDLSRRDMEMRGSGTVFGSSQSGYRDVGLDFQNKILQLAIDEIKKDLIMPCIDTRVQLTSEEHPFQLEEVGRMRLTTQPDAGVDNLSSVSRWEASLAKIVIASTVNDFLKSKGEQVYNTDAVKAMSASMVRDFFSATSRESLAELLKKWTVTFNEIGGVGNINCSDETYISSEVELTSTVPVLLQELIKRSLLRSMSRRIGIISITRIEEDCVFVSEGITDELYTELIAYLPKDLKAKILFVPPQGDIPNSRELKEAGQAKVTANSSSSSSSSSKGTALDVRNTVDSDKPRKSQGILSTRKGGNLILTDAFDGLSNRRTMPNDLLRLVVPLNDFVEYKMEAEIKRYNEATEKKKKKKESKGDTFRKMEEQSDERIVSRMDKYLTDELPPSDEYSVSSEL